MEANAIVRFFQSVFSFIRRFIFSVGLIVVAVMILIIVKSSFFAFEKPDYGSSEKIVLKMDLTGELLVKNPESSTLSHVLMRMFKEEGHEIYVNHLRSIFKKAMNDSQVQGLYIQLGSLHGPLSEFTEFRNLLAEFKASGKTLEFWSPQYENKTYYLASVASHIELAPEGNVSIPGPMFQLVYGGEAFRKLGVGFDVIRAGQFKSLFEPLISDQPSSETIRSYSGVEESLRNHLIHKIAQGRKIQEHTADLWLKRSLFSAKEAFIEKIVDGLSYREQSEERISKDAKIVEFAKYHEHHKDGIAKSTLMSKEGIAFIEAIGEIYLESNASLDSTGFDFHLLHDELKWAREEQDVKAVVLRIDSPGGAALAADLLWDDVRRLAEIKPVVVSMGAYAASGGYYMAAPATKIIAHPTTITGSIGVIGLVPNFEAFKEKYGVSFYSVSNSDRRNLLNPGTKMTDEDKEILSRHTRSTYETFVNKVATGRKKTFSEINDIAQGRIWTGAQAKEIGLVDSIGGLPDAFHTAKELAKLDLDKEYPVLYYEEPGRSLRDCLKSGRLSSCISMQGLGKVFETSLLQKTLEKTGLDRLSRVLEASSKERIFTLLPQTVEIQ